jgi:hypothetical protein
MFIQRHIVMLCQCASRVASQDIQSKTKTKNNTNIMNL